MRVLNVGGGTDRNLPPHFRGWELHTLDIDPAVKPEVCCDAKDMRRKVKAASFDAVYCSHNLEHFYRHDVPTVLGGFIHVLKASGFAQIAVPDMQALFRLAAERDIDDEWYRAPSGSVRFHDVIYGWDKAMSAGNLYYAHKCGFSEKSLTRALNRAGFRKVYTATDGANIHAFAFKGTPSAEQKRRLGI